LSKENQQLDTYQKILAKSQQSIGSKDNVIQEKDQEKYYRDLGELVIKLMDSKILSSPVKDIEKLKIEADLGNQTD